MPSDFISLFSGDLDLNAPRAFYSKESVYELLPFSTQQTTSAMSQKSGGEAGPPPSAALASDIITSSTNMGGPHTAFPKSSCPAIHSAALASDQNLFNSIDPEDSRNGRGVSEILGAEEDNDNAKSAGSCRANGEVGGRSATPQETQPYHQTTPSKRRTVLNISPPPEDLFDDSRMSCQDEASLDSEQSNSIWMEDSLSSFSIISSMSYNDNTEVPRKSRKRTPRQRPGPKSVPAEEASMDVFDADSAKGPHFVLSQLSPDNKACTKGSSPDDHQITNQKGGTLSVQYPQKCEGKELKILVQPETQHRARYLTEGSRGSVKDRTQQGFPTVKLEGVNEPVNLQVFVGNDAGRVKPHGFYQACRVTGRNTTACNEVDIEGTTVIEVSLDPSTNMTLAVDCVGILKLRNADVEARIGVAGSKKKSTRARLVFRVRIHRPDGSVLTLQTSSSSILCTQPAGLPEILKKSLHTCSVRGGEELFIIGKNFLKDTKVIFQENVSDENSWKAEAEIDMELFHQNHLIVKVPPYQNQSITSAVYVWIYVVTNAGRSHDVQPFTYTPGSANPDVSVKKETASPVKTCPYDDQIKALDGALMPSVVPSIKREEVTPMEVSSNVQPHGAFKAADVRGPAQQSTDVSFSHLDKNRPFSNNLSQPAGDSDNDQSPIFNNAEPLSTIQKQDIVPTRSHLVDALVQQGSQKFLLETRENLGQERPGSSSPTMRRLCREPASQQQQLSHFPSEDVAHLEEAVRQLKAKGFCSLTLQPDNRMAKQQQQHIQHHQQIQEQQIQQQQQVLENIQQQILQSQIQMQCGIFQEVSSQGKNTEQQGSPQGVMPSQGTIFQQAQQQQQQAALFQQSNDLFPIQTNFLQQTPSPPIFHNPTSLAKPQDPQGTVFCAQKAPHTQDQVQAGLFQESIQVLSGTTVSPEHQPSTSSIFLHQNSLNSQLSTSSTQQQQQQLAFLSALQTPAPEPHSVFQPQTQLSPIQQRSPLEQQQQPSQPHPHTQPSQQASLFQNISPHTSTNTLSPSQQQQAGLLFCSNPLSTPKQPSSLLFSSQGQMPPLTSSSLASQELPNSTVLLSQSRMVTVNQHDCSEAMAIGNPADPHQQVLFHEQQPMQLGSNSNSHQEQHVGLFMPQANMASLQGGLGAQELTQPTMFATQNSISSLQTTSSSPVQQPGTLFQSAVSGTMSQPSQPQQPALFLFGIQDECDPLINSPGNTVSDQLIALSQLGQNQRESDACIQSLLNQSLSQSTMAQSSMTSSQNMEKINDLLVSLQESGSSLSQSY
ncbi:nuclear factor of activated T-cells 5 isoform X2 [Thalassophryne amazonica]|uniref:nuclear factor of activated T-cells 5 isoform X2 n=1 Tax=Thalassophryne amazonica TaxID=390379 RepID=UPI0014710D6C|nr:nuclear factor of activated T-cells 5 isoform X2 [Thalassophryne amazonica]